MLGTVTSSRKTRAPEMRSIELPSVRLNLAVSGGSSAVRGEDRSAGSLAATLGS
jgi:hypothetical protein